MTKLILDVVLLVVSFGLLMWATRLVLGSLRVLADTTKANAYGLAAFLLALATSLPELLVGISAGIQGEGSLSLGTVLGSNIANMTLILGGAAAVAGTLKATDSFLKREVFYVFLAGAIPLLMLADETLTRAEAVVLLMVYGLFNLTVLHSQRKRVVNRLVHEDPLWRRMLVRLSDTQLEWSLVKLVGGVGMLIFSADMIVRTSVAISQGLSVPALVIGLFMVAVGTSLPELAVEITAIKRKEVQMAFGNILGSVVTNSTLILGITALLSPINLNGGARVYWVGTIGYIVAFGLFWGLVWTKRRLERWEGALLMLVYMLFAWVEIGGAR